MRRYSQEAATDGTLEHGTANKLGEVRALLQCDGGARPLEQCFELFAHVHHLCTDHASLERIAMEVSSNHYQKQTCSSCAVSPHVRVVEPQGTHMQCEN